MKKKPFGKMYVVGWEMCSTIKVSKVQIVFSKLLFMDRNVTVICLLSASIDNLAQRAFNPHKIALRGHRSTGVF